MRTFIFACIHNAGRSQMSAAFFNQLADPELCSASLPEPTLPSMCIQSWWMRCAKLELISAMRSRRSSRRNLAKNAEMLSTMGCGDECPYVPGLKRVHWPLPDPKGTGDRIGTRQTRDEIKRRVGKLLAQEQLTGNVVAA